MKYIPLIILLLFTIACENNNHIIADLILLNGNIITLDEKNPSAKAIAISDDKILAVGSSELIKKYLGETTNVIELKGLTVIPGLIEGHAHFLSLGYFKMNIDLTNLNSFDSLINKVHNKVQTSKLGEWIYGRGWHQEDWLNTDFTSIEGYPVHNELSRISPDNPVILKHRSGHAILANAKAMQIAGINSRTISPKGGKIIKYPDGMPTGIFLETAQNLIVELYNKYKKKLPQEVLEAERIKAIKLAVSECLSNGITSFHDAGASFEVIDLYKKLVDENRLGIRLWVMIEADNSNILAKADSYNLIGYGNNFLTVRAIKQYMDGALGSRGAWLLQPYSDMPTTSGFNVNAIEYLKETSEIAIKKNLQLCIHAIGDRANREVLNIYHSTFQSYPDKNNLRWRIEHAQHISTDDLPRFKKLGVIASMQPFHCISDGPWVEKRIGRKRSQEGAYLWKKLINSDVIIGCGTDAPVEPLNPFLNIFAAVTRQMENGRAFYPEQTMSRLDALKSYTINNAYSAFEEKIKGALKPGMLADIAVLSNNILTIPEDEIKKIRVVYTILGGKIVFRLNMN